MDHVLLLSKQIKDDEPVSEYVKSLASYLNNEGLQVSIVSFDDGSYYSLDSDIEVYRFPLHFDGSNIFNWSMMMNNEIKGQVMENIDTASIDVIHAHDWTTVPAAISLSKVLERPMMLTFHSTEQQRGFGTEHSEMISELEWQGAYESVKVFANNEDTKNSLLFDLDVSEDKIEFVSPLTEAWQSRILKAYREHVKLKEEV
ncbi:glycosyltransferase family 4 protein [Candidatus Nanosalina sp. VS9-1]|uniref:glycosyltransferase family 4 protein n=1 Tax=Candidatus Nanosalina sp. VS9-1 TaxID=3388566 RepID=UPI0039E11D33